jgi:hypothetical protein
MISGLVQIRIFERRYDLLAEFAKKVNIVFRGNMCFWNISRAFGANISFVSIIIMFVGWVIGIAVVTP